MFLKAVLILVGCICLGATICAMALRLVGLSVIASIFTVGVWFAISHIDDPDDDDPSEGRFDDGDSEV